MRAPLVFPLYTVLAVLGLVASGAPARAADDEAAPGHSGPVGSASAAATPASDAAGSPEGATAGTPTVENATPKKFPKLRTPSLTHRYQLGLSVAPGIGYRVIVPYSEVIQCGQQGKRVCTGLLPFFLDTQASFGFAQHWDVLLDLRFGVMTDFTQSREFAVAPGVRYWVDPDMMVKFYATIQGVYDATSQNNLAVRNNDFGFRNANGLMFEVMRNLGFYVQFGETIGLARWMRFEIDGGVGVQARMP
jgi:hypothetical protein